ncbi:class I SAM-dependent methyltransferase [Pantoea ananatis]|uniref:class I SAM-dependent methyltransferase n=1 Tax=Pantoea ananas TaxID=553 RepID=UPI0002D529BF|nr:hypothetical protein [Pantoea ananatis]
MLNIISKFRLSFKKIVESLNYIEKKVTVIEEKNSVLNEKLLQLNNYEMNQLKHSNALEHKLSSLQDRLEFIREELMFEFRIKTGTLTDRDNKNKIETKVISLDKYEKLGFRKINIGCGHIQPEGYINVDARELPGVDVICSADDLCFEDDSLEEIYASHLIEHFTNVELTRLIIPHWFKKLKTNGILRLVTPDADSMIKDYVDCNMTFDDLRKVTYGAQDYEGDFHYNMFTVDSLTSILKNAGFKDVVLAENNRKNGLCREMEIYAIKSE